MAKERGEERDNGGGGKEWLTMFGRAGRAGEAQGTPPPTPGFFVSEDRFL